MPSICNSLIDDPLLNIKGADEGHPNDDKYKIDALKEKFNYVDSFLQNSMDLNIEFIDTVIAKLELVLKELEKQQEEQIFDHHAEIFKELKNCLTDRFAEFYNLYFSTEQNLQLYVNGVNQFIDTSVANSYEHYINDCYKGTENNLIVMHLYRQGLFDVADMFVIEADVMELTDEVTGLGFKPQFKSLHDITNAVKDDQTELPLRWIAENRERLGDKKAYEFEYKIHVIKYLSILGKSGPWIDARMEAVNYAKLHLKRYANEHNRNEISKLCGCLMFERSELHYVAGFRYLHLFDGSYKRNLISEIEEQFYIMMGQCLKDPLSTVISVGARVLSGVRKAAKILRKSYQRCGWAVLGVLPLYGINLEEELKFHSQFACPRVKLYMLNWFNPPVALACNHVISFKMSLHNTFGIIVCPYCFFFTYKDWYKTIRF